MDFLRTLHSYSQLVVPGDADGERNNDGDVRKAVVELNRFLGPHLDLALQYLCSAPAGTDAWVSAFVEGMAALSLDAGVARVLMSTLEALRATRRFTLFSQAASIVSRVCGCIGCTAVRDAVLPAACGACLVLSER